MTAIPAKALDQILAQLSPKQQGALRLVCKALASSVGAQATRASSKQHLSRKAAARLQQSFPRLTSISLTDCMSAFHLPQLSGLQSVSLVPRHDSPGEEVWAPIRQDKVYSLDLSPLEGLLKLHTLRLVNCASSDSNGGGPLDFAALPGVSRLQVVDKRADGLIRLKGLHNLHKVCPTVTANC